MVVFNFRQAGGVCSFHEIFFSGIFKLTKMKAQFWYQITLIYDVLHNCIF